MKKIIKISICTMAITLSANTIAEKVGNGQITAKVSTMGLGVEYNHPVNSVLSVGFGVNKLSKSKSTTESGISYNNDLDWKSLSVIANYHPWQNGFRLRAGAYYNDNKINLKANYVATAADTIGGVSFTGATVDLNGELSFQKFAPYIGIGYGSEPIGNNNLSFDFDIGVMRSPVKSKLNGTCVGADVLSQNICATAFTDALATEQNDLTNAVDGLDLYPVISLGLSYRF